MTDHRPRHPNSPPRRARAATAAQPLVVRDAAFPTAVEPTGLADVESVDATGLPIEVTVALHGLRTLSTPATAASVARVMRAVRDRPAPVRRVPAAVDAGRSARGWRGARAPGWGARSAHSWWVGAVAAGLLVAAGLTASRSRARDADPLAQAPGDTLGLQGGRDAAGGETMRAAHFLVLAPGARDVAVVGDFNGWSAAATPMRRDAGSGAWTARVPLPAGRYVYAFVVDGVRWMADPNAPLAPADGFGRQSSVLVLGTQFAAV